VKPHTPFALVPRRRCAARLAVLLPVLLLCIGVGADTVSAVTLPFSENFSCATGNAPTDFPAETVPANRVLISENPSTENSTQFSTKSLDLQTGLNYYGYRFYNSAFGCWLSRDWIEFELIFDAKKGNGQVGFFELPGDGEASLGRSRVTLDWGSIVSHETSKTNESTKTFQRSILHEMGHLFGLLHSGGVSNASAAYDPDTESLMGRGEIMRSWDFPTAFCSHIEASGCSSWNAVGKDKKGGRK
jgi:RHS repeat-associated protein